MKAKEKKTADEMRSEYDFDYSEGVRGKYYKRLMAEGANIVMLEPDVARSFADSDAVNEALRSLLDLAKTTQRLTKHFVPLASSAKSGRKKTTQRLTKHTGGRAAARR